MFFHRGVGSDYRQMSLRQAALWLVLAGCFITAAWSRAPLAATTLDTSVYVEIKADESADARVIERWKLYNESHALVIGIDDYTNGWPRLSNAVSDAERVAKALKTRGFGVTLLRNVTSAELRRELRRFFTLKGTDPETRLFVWFSGHGHSEFGEGYLVPSDAPLPDNREFLISALHMRDFGGLVRLAKAKHAMAIFDSCFAGTVFSVQRSRPPAAITRATVKPVRQFLTSGDADQQVSDDGTFSRLLIEAIEGNARADANNDGYLTGSELSLHLEQRVTNLTQGLQTPRSGKLRDPRYDGGDFVFLLPHAQVAVAATPGALSTESRSAEPAPPRAGPNDATFDLEFWNAIKDSGNAADFLAYLESFPNGRFAPLARVRVNSLKPADVEPEPEPEPASEAQPVPQVAESPAESAAERELSAWDTVRGSQAPGDFEAFLQEFPDGNFAELARFRLDQLTPKQTALVVAPPKPEPPEPTPPQVSPAVEPSLEPIEEDYRAVRNANVRGRPDRNADKTGFVRKGNKIFVRGKVSGTRWLAVELDGDAIGYVYAPLLAPAQTIQNASVSEPGVDQPGAQTALLPTPKEIPLEPIGDRYRAVKSASVRTRPDVGSRRIDTLRQGTSVQVAGKVVGENWLSIERDGKHFGYVYAPLLARLEDSGSTQAKSPEPKSTQSAALTPAANPFDGSWQGQGVGNSEVCGGTSRISLITRGQTVSGTYEEAGRKATISGRLDHRGQFAGVFATIRQIRVEFQGAVSGGRVTGRWKGEKRKDFGEITCAGRFELGPQGAVAGAGSSAQVRTAQSQSTQVQSAQVAPAQTAARTTGGFDGSWGGTGTGTSDTCHGSFQISFVTQGSTVKGEITTGSRSATISGELDRDGRFERTFATVKGIFVEFTGRISGDRLTGSWIGEKRKDFGEIVCKGTMSLSRLGQ